MIRSVFGIAALLLSVLPAAAQSAARASAYCKITGVTGYGASRQSETAAMEAAIKDCVRKGGIPACCRVGARVEER